MKVYGKASHLEFLMLLGSSLLILKMEIAEEETERYLRPLLHKKENNTFQVKMKMIVEEFVHALNQETDLQQDLHKEQNKDKTQTSLMK